MTFSPDQNIKPQKGQVLLSEPFLNDPYFRRTVIFLCEHNDDGSFGFVLNNYIDVELDQIMENMPKFEGKISIGGPVKNSNLYYIHTLGKEISDSVEVIPGIFMGGNFETLKDRLIQGKIDRSQIRFFVGYSGWSPKQLEGEMKLRSWFVANINSDVVMNTDISDLWRTVMKSMGGKGKIIANLPEDPTLN
ncbi:MAG: YqgE/AlgH family protein [Flavobacteriales bacterium]|nr:YqgE/AlgH family protein [Flavobacteriales bacterium]